MHMSPTNFVLQRSLLKLHKLATTNLLQEQFPILVEKEYAEGSMENPPGRARHKPMRQVFVHMAHNLIVLVQRDHLSDVCGREIEENTLDYAHAKGNTTT